MEKEKPNVRIGEDGSRSASVPFWQELPEITVHLRDGHTDYCFTGSFDGKHTLPDNVLKLMEDDEDV